MKKIFLPILILTLLFSGCQSNSAQEDTANSPAPASQDNSSQPAGEEPAQDDQDSSSPTPPLEQPLETLGPDCYGEEIHPIGQSIADLYPEQTDYEQVMVWFCNGFEFEDIMTALQTAEGSDFSAEELLAKFEHGQTWDEIWAELGIVEP
jgi:hypothetical protein